MAKKDVAGERALPPYVSFKTFQGFIQKLKATTVPACLSFYVAALRAAGVPVSPHVVHKARGRPDRARGRSKRTSTESEKPQADGSMMDTVPAAAAVGTVRFSFPIPSKAAVTMF